MTIFTDEDIKKAELIREWHHGKTQFDVAGKMRSPLVGSFLEGVRHTLQTRSIELEKLEQGTFDDAIKLLESKEALGGGLVSEHCVVGQGGRVMTAYEWSRWLREKRKK